MRILIVDDEAFILSMMEDFFLGRNDDVVTASGGEEALDKIASNSYFDVIICDVRMPGMNGWKLRERLVINSSPLASKFIFMSGYIPQDDILQAIQMCGQPFLPKPFLWSQVSEAVESILHR